MELRFQRGWVPDVSAMLRLLILCLGCGALLGLALGSAVFGGYFTGAASILLGAVVTAVPGVVGGIWASWFLRNYEKPRIVEGLIYGSIIGAVIGALLGLYSVLSFGTATRLSPGTGEQVSLWGAGGLCAVGIILALISACVRREFAPGEVVFTCFWLGLPYWIAGYVAGAFTVAMSFECHVRLGHAPELIAHTLFGNSSTRIWTTILFSTGYGATGGLSVWVLRMLISFFSKEERHITREARFSCIIPGPIRELIRTLQEQFSEVHLVAEVSDWLAPKAVHPARTPTTDFLIIVRKGQYWWLAAAVLNPGTKPTGSSLEDLDF